MVIEIGSNHGLSLVYEDETGDPIFIDIEDGQFPVYTVMHGEGDWEPHKISVSLNGNAILFKGKNEHNEE